MDERLKFIARLLDGEKMAVLCRQFGISRKTGYKMLTHYNEIGLEEGAKGTALSLPGQPNDLWCADYKGEFMLADRRYCYPLTITDLASRYLFACEALSTTKEAYAFPVFEAVFKEFGLPKAIRTDNGVPFASPNALFGLSKLSAWWLRLGIEIERIKPGHPQQNGRHERMQSDLDAQDHQAGRQQLPAAAGQVRQLHRLLQQ